MHVARESQNAIISLPASTGTRHIGNFWFDIVQHFLNTITIGMNWQLYSKYIERRRVRKRPIWLRLFMRNFYGIFRLSSCYLCFLVLFYWKDVGTCMAYKYIVAHYCLSWLKTISFCAIFAIAKQISWKFKCFQEQRRQECCKFQRSLEKSTQIIKCQSTYIAHQSHHVVSHLAMHFGLSLLLGIFKYMNKLRSVISYD